jgi:tetratricopeptide (TPR) repeat protein
MAVLAMVGLVVTGLALARSHRRANEANSGEMAAARASLEQSTLDSSLTDQRALEAAAGLQTNPRRGITEARRLLDEDPRSQQALDLLTLAYDRVRAQGLTQAEETELREEEVGDYERLLKQTPDRPEVLFRCSFHRLALQRLRPSDPEHAEAAVAHMRRLLATLDSTGARQDLPAAHNQLGRAYRHLADALGLHKGREAEADRFYTLAVNEFTTALDLDPNRLDALGEMVLVHQAKNSIDVARHAVESHLPKVTRSEARAKAHEMLGALYIQLGQSDQAIHAFRTAIDADDTSDASYLYLSQLYSESGDARRAEETLRASIKNEPRFVEAHLKLAQLLQGQSRFGDAITALETALRIAPADAVFMGAGGAAVAPSRNLYRNTLYYSAAASLAWLYLDHAGKPKEALSAVNKAHQWGEPDPHLLDTLGWIHHALGDDTLAVTILQSAAARKSFPAVHHHLAQIHLKHGHLERAKEEVERALQSTLPFPSRHDAEQLNRLIEMQLARRPSK